MKWIAPFLKLIEVHNNNEKGSKVEEFLIEKIQSFKNYDFLPEEERFKNAAHKRERWKLGLGIIKESIGAIRKLFFGG